MNNRIREIRNKEKLTLKELSQKIGIASNTLSQYETGKREPKLEMWQALATYFNVSIAYLQGLGVSRSEAINDIVNKMIDERDSYSSVFTEIAYDLQEKLTRSDAEYINSTWGSISSSPNKFVDNLIDNNNRQALGYLVGKYVSLVNDYKFLASVPNDVDAYYEAIENKYNNDKFFYLISKSKAKEAIKKYIDEELAKLGEPKNKNIVLFNSICDLFVSDIDVKTVLLSYSDDRKVEINKNVRALFNLLTTDTDDKRVLEIRENVKDQLDAYANDNED